MINLAALCFLGWKLFCFEDYTFFFQTIHQGLGQSLLPFIALFLLWPVNFSFEALKWQYLLKPIHPLHFKSAWSAIFHGQSGAFITPNRLGEFPSRSLLLPPTIRPEAITNGFLGSFVQTFLICSIGLIALKYNAPLYFNTGWGAQEMQAYTSGVILGLSLILVFLLSLPYLGRKITQLTENKSKKRWRTIYRSAQNVSTFTAGQLLHLALLCLARYATFLLQYYLALKICGLTLPFYEALPALACMYLFITLTPSIGLTDIGVKSSWALVALAPFTNLTPNIFMATALIWLINVVLPLILASTLHTTRSIFTR